MTNPFPSAPGYGNLPNGYFSADVYSKKVLMSLKNTLVSDKVTNTEFEGEINQMGTTVHIIKQPNVTVSNYVRGMKVIPQDLNDEEIQMVIDQAKYYAFAMDDIEKKHEHVSFEDMAVDSAAYAIKNAVDADIFSTMSSAITTNSIGSVTVGFGTGNTYTPTDLISHFAKVLDDANVSDDDRFFVGSPAFFEALRREDSKLFDASATGDSKSPARTPNGIYAMLHGFEMYKSNNLPTSGTVMLAGSKQAMATASSILESEVIRNGDSFGDIYRGLYVYGRKVLREVALAKATVTSYTDA